MTKTPLVLALTLLLPHTARAEAFAEPPGTPLLPTAPPATGPQEFPAEEPLSVAASAAPELAAVRLGVGPVLRVAPSATDGGLLAAADVGNGPAGVRLTGAWVRAGSERGLSTYQGELFVDFGGERRLRPIVGAGAGVARLGTRASDGRTKLSTYGIGVLRATLEVLLPVERADARVGVDASAGVPAVQSRSAPDAAPWLLLSARVGVGF
jgi:hypothetical protein